MRSPVYSGLFQHRKKKWEIVVPDKKTEKKEKAPVQMKKGYNRPVKRERTYKMPETPPKQPVRRRPDSTVQAEPGDNTRYLSHSMKIYRLPKVDMTNEVEVADRITEYFDICTEDDMKPSVAGLALALDTDRTYLYQLRVGMRGKNKEVANLLKKACAFMEAQMNDYMQNGKINPVAGIFLMKNHFAYQDKQEVVVTPNNPLGDIDQKSIEERYAESIPEIEEYTEKE